MARLFSYTIPIDDGAAPNPFQGMCTLAICKPVIRRVAREGDWVAGLGSRNAPSGDLSGRLVYAMRVEEILSLGQYDRQAQSRWPHRIPKLQSADVSERLGDCVYDFSSGVPVQRQSVHGPLNIRTDLAGQNALISRDFYYFGSCAIILPDFLLPITHQTQGHRSNSNAPYLAPFVRWLRGLNLTPCQLYGRPDFHWATAGPHGGCAGRRADGESDMLCGQPDCLDLALRSAMRGSEGGVRALVSHLTCGPCAAN